MLWLVVITLKVSGTLFHQSPATGRDRQAAASACDSAVSFTSFAAHCAQSDWLVARPVPRLDSCRSLWPRCDRQLRSFQQHELFLGAFVEQPEVLACLSRRRSWVQIPSGTLIWRGTRIGIATKLKPWVLRVRLPPASLLICVGWALAGPAGCKPVVRMDLGGSTPSRRTQNRSPWRGAMMVLQRGFQSRQRGFESRPRH